MSKTAEEFAQEIHAIIGGTIKPKELKGIQELFEQALYQGKRLALNEISYKMEPTQTVGTRNTYPTHKAYMKKIGKVVEDDG